MPDAHLRLATAASVVVRVPAKVNLGLSVHGLRPDGFHELRTVFQAVSLYDEVSVSPAARYAVAISGEGAGELPKDRSNLAVRAARLLAERTRAGSPVRIELRKSIPVAGGMAGGSADAAATLLACDRLWGTGLSRAELLELAAELGSDVPFALLGGTALGVGRGEVVTPVLSKGQFHWVLALAEGGLSTPAVFAELDRLGGISDGGVEGVLSALREADPVALGRTLCNDLQFPALSLRPSLGRVLDSAMELGALGAIVSGSGPTVAVLARDAADSTRITAALAGMGVCRTVRRAHGPVVGARVVDAA